jgi:hypothetical protein
MNPHQSETLHTEFTEREHDYEHDDEGHEHSHSLVDRSILRSRAGIRAVSRSLAVLTVTALA